MPCPDAKSLEEARAGSEGPLRTAAIQRLFWFHDAGGKEKNVIFVFDTSYDKRDKGAPRNLTISPRTYNFS